MVYYLKVNVLFKYFMLEARKLKIWGVLSAECICFYSWRSILAEKLAVPLSMDIVTDITTGE